MFAPCTESESARHVQRTAPARLLGERKRQGAATSRSGQGISLHAASGSWYVALVVARGTI